MDAKIRLEGAQRSCTPQETIDRMRPHFYAAGITRIADITGLDWIGIPVAQCVRPDAVMLAVDSGKGVTPEAARCSAMMEGFERHVGETASVSHVLSTANDIGDRAEYQFQLLKGASFSKDRPMRWTNANKLGSGMPVMVPEVVVRMSSRQPTYPLFHSCFTATSNGLSSGNTRDEAICGGLYEVIERDQVTASTSGDLVRVDLSTAKDESLVALIQKLKKAGVEPILFDCTREIGVPTFTAFIYDQERGTGLYKGYAAHLDPAVAQCRAICEAVQARGVWRAGSRDDILHSSFQNHLNGDKPDTIQSLLDAENTVPCDKHPDLSSDSFFDDIKTLVSKVTQAGFPEPLVKEFDHPYPCSVVRILAPRMHGYHHAFGRCETRPNHE
jgi:ribosomal protein S12 methylthiotransferase accessory factor